MFNFVNAKSVFAERRSQLNIPKHESYKQQAPKNTPADLLHDVSYESYKNEITNANLWSHQTISFSQCANVTIVGDAVSHSQYLLHVEYTAAMYYAVRDSYCLR